MAYATAAELAARYPTLTWDSLDAAEIDAELSAASSWIDGHCNRTFAAEGSVTVRYFVTQDRYTIDLGPYEISTTDGVVIATDDGAGTYSTTVSASAYVLEPVNAVYASPDPRPFTSVRAIGTTWPYAVTANERQERIKITAKYGWPAVPEPVKRACLTLAANAFENPSGVRSEAIDGYSVTYMTAAGMEIGVPASVVAGLRAYVRGWAA
jgi:hypothetical protein